ncbi:tetratricopeptide repeat-containing sensor histidine kinase [uncultured Winogradskyella sp.]|uniref:tetratricopeptide repeat-containing sensor histidine kinase n=1 Tax=uncultured Winogradskyella sp. TaxID=395353 RepID=UPI002602741D|nr:tetratricopeptide repeat-containing sensor histidine kinase [uncultured Winogradskyella sp.]
MKQLLFIFLCFIATGLNFSQSKAKLDSISKYYFLSKTTNLDLDKRLEYALKSLRYADDINVDSISLRVQRNLSIIYFFNEKYDKYVPLNRENYELALKLNDTNAITVTSSNLGSYYRFNQQNDSAYFFYSKALEYYGPKEISENKAEALYYLADIQQLERAYIGSEEDAFKAIIILNRLERSEDRLDLYWSLYNLLAINSEKLIEYNNALEYYEKSISYAKDMEDGFINEVFSINNKANIYRLMGNYSKALELFEDLLPLRPEYDDEDPTFYPAIIINIAKTQFESGNYKFKTVENYFKEAYEISKELSDEFTIMAVASEMAKFYFSHNKRDLVIKYGSEALAISNRISNNEYKMDVLLTLSHVYEGEKGKSFLREHIRISDSLEIEQRAVGNKFARVKYETDQLEAENEQISKENFYLAILSVGLLLTAVLVYVVISQRAKNRKLKLIQVQQKANEDIYNLMLGQQDKVDEARTQEKKRISEELHDGVLGRLFGTRLSLDSINFKDGKEAMMTRANYIGQLKTIEEDIRKISHELNTDFVSGTGFMDIVSELIENQTQAYGLKYDFDYTDDISWDIVPNKTKINIYRIIQESMQNIYKHANAKAIKISISLEKSVICLDIIDDGEGFDTSKSKKGIGLKNMTSRVEDINGKITFTSQSGNGTIVNVKIPYINQST